ncbi:hypothetical protein IMSHALPRED_004407 [Imshaugia aleurites]|uniref:Uncharacterized protein n=1 Tax=Imshaugia aleurites TaxID=172621 RepID=A0A8H3F834_9LECA|nr:hypothetical protein IMSHALPRED_004407 [Imshaugia aleurites]
MSLAPPVSRSNFHYNGDLYVEVGTLNRHKRATIEEITAILRPDLKKKSPKSSIDAPKDQVGHWYEAQLIHYGLPPSKDKARAKMRLLEALNSTRLAVPPNIAQMEAEMKREYAAAERKAKAQYKASREPAQKNEPVAAGKKRKQSEPSVYTNNINVNISLGTDFRGLPGAVYASEGQSPAKKAKTGPSKPASKKTEGLGSSKPSKKATEPRIEQPSSPAQQAPKRPIQAARSAKLTEAWLKDPSIGPGPVGYSTTPSSRFSLADGNPPQPSITKKAGAAKDKAPATMQPNNNKKDSKVKQEPKVEGKTQIKKEVGAGKESKANMKTKVKKEPSAKSPPKIKPEPDTDTSHTPNLPAVGFINGIYDLSCPTVAREWGSTDLTLTLALEGTTVWGAYDLGMFSGILFLPNRPWHASNEALPFTWRGRENGEGEMSFGHGCQGEISFLGKGRVEGWISVYGRCAFTGVRRAGAGTVATARPARSMKGEWEGYNERTYDEERSGRWG